MSDFYEVAEMPMDQALGLTGRGGAVSVTDIASRNVDIRSGSVNVRDANGNTISLGLMDDGTLGLQVKDSSGYVLFTLNGTTWKWNDKVNAKNVMQVGKLPDATYGTAVAKAGFNVSDGIS